MRQEVWRPTGKIVSGTCYKVVCRGTADILCAVIIFSQTQNYPLALGKFMHNQCLKKLGEGKTKVQRTFAMRTDSHGCRPTCSKSALLFWICSSLAFTNPSSFKIHSSTTMGCVSYDLWTYVSSFVFLLFLHGCM